jgi:hypothetical protein
MGHLHCSLRRISCLVYVPSDPSERSFRFTISRYLLIDKSFLSRSIIIIIIIIINCNIRVYRSILISGPEETILPSPRYSTSLNFPSQRQRVSEECSTWNS